MKLNNDWLTESGQYKCPHCNKQYSKKGIMGHIIWTHTDDGRKRMLDNINKIDHSCKLGKPTWNTGLTKETDIRVRKLGEKISQIQLGKPGHPHTEETKKQLSTLAIKNELGGHTSKKQLYFKAKDGRVVYLQSSYEIKVATELDANDIKWERPNYLWWVDTAGIKHRYYADFYLNDYNIFLDPKNYYLQIKDKVKMQSVEVQNNIKIIVLSENELNWNEIKNKICSRSSVAQSASLVMKMSSVGF